MLAGLIFCGVFALCSATYKSYSGYQVLKFLPQSKTDLEFLKDIRRSFNDGQIDVWRMPARVGEAAHLLVGPEAKVNVLRRQLKSSIISTQIDDLERKLMFSVINEQAPKPASYRRQGLRSDPRDFDLNDYHSFDEINEYLERIALENTDFVKLDILTDSFEGRPMKYLKIGYSAVKGTKKALLVDAGIHAREWIATASALYLIDYLIRENPPILREIDIIIVPCMNPDGYEYTRNVDRLWRKSRSGPYGSLSCFGVDMNRNFPAMWCFNGASRSACDYQTFCGRSPLSEPETRALVNFVIRNKATIRAYVTLHSYGNYVIFPWGYEAGIYPPNVRDLRTLAQDIRKAIFEENGNHYQIGTASDLLNYTASGASDDFFKMLGIQYTFTLEISETHYGFLLPAWMIESEARGAIKGILVVADAVAQKN